MPLETIQQHQEFSTDCNFPGLAVNSSCTLSCKNGMKDIRDPAKSSITFECTSDRVATGFDASALDLQCGMFSY